MGFSTASLNDLIDEAVACKGEIATVNDGESSIAKTEPSSFSEAPVVSNDGDSIDHDLVYKKIGELIDNGNLVLQMFQSVDPDVTEPTTLTAIASLMNAIKGCIAEYTKIHAQSVKFKQAKEMEALRQANRLQAIQFRKDVYNGEQTAQEVALHEIGSNDLVEFLLWKKEKEEERKKKEEGNNGENAEN